MVVAPTEDGAEGIRETIHELAAYFYAYDGLVTLPWTEQLQRAFNFLTDILNRVGIHMNVRKTVRMAC